MNRIWNSSKCGMYNSKELAKRLGLSGNEFNKLMELEAERYKAAILRKYGKTSGAEYYAAKLTENPLIAKYGFTPTFKPHPFKTGSCIFNDESGVYLEKTWSNKNKYNIGKDLPFNFIFQSNS